MEEKLRYIKRLLDRMSMDTIMELSAVDKVHAALDRRAEELQEVYAELALEETDRAVVESLLKTCEDLDNNRSILVYMAGVLDCISFLVKSDVLEI